MQMEKRTNSYILNNLDISVIPHRRSDNYHQAHSPHSKAFLNCSSGEWGNGSTGKWGDSSLQGANRGGDSIIPVRQVRKTRIY